MGKLTAIAWTDHTFNPWWGCEKISPGCKHCYAESWATGRMRLPIWGADAERRFFGDEHWKGPEVWNRAAMKSATRARVFCASMADVFEDRPDLIEHRARLFDLIDRTRWLDWMLLTKRPENMTRLAPASWRDGWPGNVWAGATTESQAMADERVPQLLRVPAVVRFLSVEPQFEEIALTHLAFVPRSTLRRNDIRGDVEPRVHWVIQGGESGKAGRPRPFDLAWARSMRAQCADAGVAYFLKQLGAHPVSTGKRRYLADSTHGANEEEWPEDLRGYRAFPTAWRAAA